MCNNCVTTECGHLFHSSCLMKSVSIIGFTCPYCRTIMAEKIKDNDDDESYTSYDEEMIDEYEYALRGFRFLFNNLNGHIHEQQDNEDEDEDEEYENEAELEIEPVQNVNGPSYSFITQKLIEQGVTMELLVRAIMSCDTDGKYGADHYENDCIERQVTGRMARIINDYNSSQTIQQS